MQKLTSINAAITLTAEAYGRAQAGMAAGSSEETEASREAARSAAAELERLASEPGAEYAVLAAEAAKECGQLEAAIAPLAEARRALRTRGFPRALHTHQDSMTSRSKCWENWKRHTRLIWPMI